MNNIESSTGEIVMYQPDETIRLEVRVENDTVWLTQQQMADLFLTTKQNVSLHINNILSKTTTYKSGLRKPISHFEVLQYPYFAISSYSCL